jgi:hypothetical protein
MLRRDFISVFFLLCCLTSVDGDEVMQSRVVIANDGAELATQAMGRPLRGTILLAMGATASMVWWPDSMVARLAESGYQVIRFFRTALAGAPLEGGVLRFSKPADERKIASALLEAVSISRRTGTSALFKN